MNMTNISFAAIILAAGSSSRIGTPKQLLRFKQKTMLELAISAALGAGIQIPVVVIGASAERIRKNVPLLKSCKVLYNKKFSDGQSSSLQCGVNYVLNKCDAAIFMLADQPLVNADLVLKLLREYTESKPDILYPTYNNQRGNPVIIGAKLFSRLLEITGDEGARSLLNDTSLNIQAYEVNSKAVITDIDTWADYTHLESQ